MYTYQTKFSLVQKVSNVVMLWVRRGGGWGGGGEKGKLIRMQIA